MTDIQKHYLKLLKAEFEGQQIQLYVYDALHTKGGWANVDLVKHSYDSFNPVARPSPFQPFNPLTSWRIRPSQEKAEDK